MIIEHPQPIELAKEIFWLAFQACGGPFGMGVLQDRPGITKEDVWSRVIGETSDYPVFRGNMDMPHADYVFGRMMKLGLAIREDSIVIPDETPQLDYQAWCAVYPSYKSLVEEALKNEKDRY